MGVLNFYLSKWMAENDREEARKEAEKQAFQRAQGQADYAGNLLGSSGWQTWNQDGSLGAPSGMPAELGVVPTTKDWRYAPDMAARTVGDMLEYKQAPVLADQKNELGRRAAIFNLDTEKQLAPGKRELAAGDFDAQTKYDPRLGNEVLAAKTRQPYVVGLTNTKSQEEQIAANNALQKVTELQRIGYPTQEARAALANSRAGEGQDLVSRVAADAALGRKDLIEAGTVGGLQNKVMQNTYPGIERNIPEGKQLVVDANSGEMSVIDAPGYKDPMAGLVGSNPVVDKIGESAFPKKQGFQFTTRGVIGGPSLRDVVVGANNASTVAPTRANAAVIGQPLIDEDTANVRLNTLLAGKHPDTAANMRDAYSTAARKAIASEIGLPAQSIGSSVFNRNPATVLSEAINAPDGTNIVSQIQALTPAQKNRIYRKALAEVGLK